VSVITDDHFRIIMRNFTETSTLIKDFDEEMDKENLDTAPREIFSYILDRIKLLTECNAAMLRLLREEYSEEEMGRRLKK